MNPDELLARHGGEEGAASHRCAPCNATFPDYRTAFEHISHAHPEVPRWEIGNNVIAAKVPAPREQVEASSNEAAPRRRSGGKAPGVIVAQWSQLIEGLRASPLAFYDSIGEALAKREVPDLSESRVDYREAGLLSAKREYLRTTRGGQTIDVCAAPFGTGFFVSWWIGEARPGPLVPTLILIAIAVAFVQLFGVFTAVIALVVVFLIMGALISQEEAPWHPYAFAVPVAGPLWERLFRPPTLYRHDTMLMFKAAVHQAVLEVIDGLTKVQGLRALSEDERKPILRNFTRR